MAHPIPETYPYQGLWVGQNGGPRVGHFYFLAHPRRNTHTTRHQIYHSPRSYTLVTSPPFVTTIPIATPGWAKYFLAHVVVHLFGPP